MSTRVSQDIFSFKPRFMMPSQRFINTLLLAGKELVDEEHVARLVSVRDLLQLIEDVLHRASAEPRAR